MNFRAAQTTLWGQAGAWAFDTWSDLNAGYFDGELKYVGIVWGLTPRGARPAHTAPSGRITLHPALVEPASPEPWDRPRAQLTDRFARDVLLHELIHQALYAKGEPSGPEPHHNTRAWCEQIVRLSRLELDREVKAQPIHPRRMYGKSIRQHKPGYLSRARIANWPHSVRPNAASYYRDGDQLTFSNER